MKTTVTSFLTCHALAIASLLWSAAPRALAADPKTNRATSEHTTVTEDAASETKVVVKVVTDDDEKSRPAKDRAWLGVAVEEASEALTDQLGLDAGVGLVVTHVSADSPAAKAGLKKNDLLVELAGQSLVLPAQLRKLVQVRKPGDKIKLVFYRGGKKHTESATLELAPSRLGWLEEGGADAKARPLYHDRIELPPGDALQARAKALHESWRPIPGEMRRRIETEIQHGLEHARQAIVGAAREVDHNKDSLRAEIARLKETLKSDISVDDHATVVVRSKGKSSRSLVKTDDAGTLVVIGPPDLHLTARDKNGKLIFEGEIETPEQRAKVPAEVWQRVEPLLDEKSDASRKPGSE